MTIAPTAATEATPAPGFIGRDFFPGHIVPVNVTDNEELLPAVVDNPRLAIVLVRRGSCLIELAATPLLVSAPTALLLDESTRPALRRADALDFSVIYFHPSVVNSAFTPEILRKTPLFAGTNEQDAYLIRPFFAAENLCRPLALTFDAGERMTALARHVVAEGAAQADGNWPCRTRSYLIEMLIALRVFIDRPPDAPPLAAGSRIDKALLYVHDHFNHDFTIADLARHCGSNRTTIAAEFRELTGQSVRGYAIGLRMRMAAALLTDTLLPVAEIMNRAGYDNASSFTRTFRTAFGMTPSGYRAARSWMVPRN
jgi:AraC family L-rhamnose operon regulatory protein RhaS